MCRRNPNALSLLRSALSPEELRSDLFVVSRPSASIHIAALRQRCDDEEVFSPVRQ